ncbi:MAG: hypothetical protein KBT29_04800 [Prevotellaceae bacterium]|nr:hypothetical protein [Candidatus Minthosoma caballi]
MKEKQQYQITHQKNQEKVCHFKNNPYFCEAKSSQPNEKIYNLNNMKQLRKTFSFAAVILFMVAMCPMKMQAKIVKWHNAANATVTSLQLGIIAPENGAPVAPTPAAQNAVALTTDMFGSWNSQFADGVRTGNAECAYHIGAKTYQLYGDGKAYYLNYANLDEY